LVLHRQARSKLSTRVWLSSQPLFCISHRRRGIERLKYRSAVDAQVAEIAIGTKRLHS
jgi:hypothetical protein